MRVGRRADAGKWFAEEDETGRLPCALAWVVSSHVHRGSIMRDTFERLATFITEVAFIKAYACPRRGESSVLVGVQGPLEALCIRWGLCGGRCVGLLVVDGVGLERLEGILGVFVRTDLEGIETAALHVVQLVAEYITHGP